jgi:hypothetical protein
MDDEFGQDYLYKIQLLQACGLDKWYDDKVNIVISDTFNKIVDIDVFREIIDKAKKNNKINTSLLNIINNEIISDTQLNKLVFELLFNYDFFDLLHRCLCEQLTNSRVCDYTRDLLLNNL